MKVRFAPSPTGYLHIGGARTALFNYIYTKKNKGLMVLRIEDTDLKRSSKEMVTEIIDGLEWIGIEWDEGPYYQSDNFNKYKEYADKLVDNKLAYPCFCTNDEIEERKNNNPSGKKVYKYDRKCLNLSQEEIKEKLDNGIKPVIRFFVPEGKTSFKDKIHKELTIDNNELEDFVLMKSDGSPTYHLSVVADDNDMGITHIIRGDDHLSNTFKQILLYKALGLKIPKFFHLPLILGKDKKKLSKRHGETSVLEFKHRGYLPEAMLTYLAQLSWNPGDTKKILSLKELIEKLDFSKLSKNSPEFDYDKLLFLNSKAIQIKSASTILKIISEDKRFKDKFDLLNDEYKEEFIELIKPRMKTLTDIKKKFYIYFNDNLEYSLDNIIKTVKSKSILDLILYFTDKLNDIKEFNAKNIEFLLREISEDMNVKAADIIHPCRLALTTETVSPGIFDVFAFFGKNESVKRLQHFIKQVKKDAFPD